MRKGARGCLDSGSTDRSCDFACSGLGWSIRQRVNTPLPFPVEVFEKDSIERIVNTNLCPLFDTGAAPLTSTGGFSSRVEGNLPELYRASPIAGYYHPAPPTPPSMGGFFGELTRA